MTVDEKFALAKAEEEKGSQADAIRRYKEIISQAFGYGPARIAAQRLAKKLFADAMAVRDRGDEEGAIGLLVSSVELNPASGEVRQELARILGLRPTRDMTSECLIFPDAQRATQFYGDTIQTAIDFCVYGGISGDILEFGVLAGWTARLFAERMRDTQFFGDLHLFDSFKGLPRQKNPIDAASHDVVRGIWQDEMELPASLITELGMPIDLHIKRMLSRVISSERIHVHKGYFSETLNARLPHKAAIVHLDCDLYQSTMEVLDALERDETLQDGTILMFDDWNCNRANPAFGQRRALGEFLDRSKGRYSTSHFRNYGFNCAAFILHDMAGKGDVR